MSSSSAPRLALCARIEAIVAELIGAIQSGRDPAFCIGLGSFVSASAAGGGFSGAHDLAGLLKVLRIVYECALVVRAPPPAREPPASPPLEGA